MSHPKYLASLFALAAAGLAACGSASSRVASWSPPTDYVCRGGHIFSVEFRANEARVTTSEGSWVMEERRSSIGRRFGTESAAFMEDEDRAALNGVLGGPFRECHRLGPQEGP